LNFYDKFIKIYREVAIAWLRKCLNKPLSSIYKEYDQSFLIDSDSLKKEKLS
jgi:hypothetical protein